MTVDEDLRAALEAEIVRPVWLAFVDLDGDPIRVSTAGYDVTFADTGDAELDGFTFSAIDPSVLDVSEVSHREGGSENVTVTLSGILDLDQDILDAIGDRTKYQGRICRLWVGARDTDGNFIGLVLPYYTGWMMAPELVPGPAQQIIRMTVMGYQSMDQDAANRTWLDQKLYDADDTSPESMLASVNGARGGPGAAVGYGGVGASPGALERQRALGLIRPF